MNHCASVNPAIAQELGRYGSYAGLAKACNLHDPADVQCSIRFQTTFLPVQATEAPGKLEFATDTGQHWPTLGITGHYWGVCGYWLLMLLPTCLVARWAGWLVEVSDTWQLTISQ